MENKKWIGGLDLYRGFWMDKGIDKVPHDLKTMDRNLSISDLWDYGTYTENGDYFNYIHFVYDDKFLTIYHIFYNEKNKRITEDFEFHSNIEIYEDNEFTYYKDFNSEFEMLFGYDVHPMFGDIDDMDKIKKDIEWRVGRFLYDEFNVDLERKNGKI